MSNIKIWICDEQDEEDGKEYTIDGLDFSDPYTYTQACCFAQSYVEKYYYKSDHFDNIDVCIRIEDGNLFKINVAVIPSVRFLAGKILQC